MITLIILVVSIVICLIMIFAFIATKNSIIDIITSFETQNSRAYEVRYNAFANAVTLLDGLNVQMNEDIRKEQLNNAFNDLLIVADKKLTLSAFEKAVEAYYSGEDITKHIRKFKAMVRQEFSNSKYTSKYIVDMTASLNINAQYEEKPIIQPEIPVEQPPQPKVLKPQFLGRINDDDFSETPPKVQPKIVEQPKTFNELVGPSQKITAMPSSNQNAGPRIAPKPLVKPKVNIDPRKQ